MPRKEQGWITFQSSEEEREILEEFCQQSQRTKTEILRELVRGLKQSAQSSASAVSPPPAPEPPKQVVILAEEDDLEIEFQAIRVSARNVIRGTIRKIVASPVNTEVTLEIAPNVSLVSVITTASAQRLQLHEGKEMFAVIKSSNIMLAEGE